MDSKNPVSNATPTVSILIVNYNTVHLLDELFATLNKATSNISSEVILIDNASRDNSVEYIKHHFPDIKLIVNTDNVGFGRANNQCLAEASGEYILLLNTDAFVRPDTIEKTLRFMQEHDSCGVLGVKLISRDGSLQPSCRYFPTPLNIFVAKAGLQRFFPSLQMVDDLKWAHDEVRNCDWVPGCYYLVRRSVIDQVGLFDPRYFLYYEEVDHCLATKKAGWDVIYFPDTEVIHLGGESASSDAELTSAGKQIDSMQIESELLYFRKNAGFFSVVADVLLQNLADIILLLKKLIKRTDDGSDYNLLRRIPFVWEIFKKTYWGLRSIR